MHWSPGSASASQADVAVVRSTSRPSAGDGQVGHEEIRALHEALLRGFSSDTLQPPAAVIEEEGDHRPWREPAARRGDPAPAHSHFVRSSTGRSTLSFELIELSESGPTRNASNRTSGYRQWPAVASTRTSVFDGSSIRDARAGGGRGEAKRGGPVAHARLSPRGRKAGSACAFSGARRRSRKRKFHPRGDFLTVCAIRVPAAPVLPHELRDTMRRSALNVASLPPGVAMTICGLAPQSYLRAIVACAGGTRGAGGGLRAPLPAFVSHWSVASPRTKHRLSLTAISLRRLPRGERPPACVSTRRDGRIYQHDKVDAAPGRHVPSGPLRDRVPSVASRTSGDTYAALDLTRS